MAAARPTSDTMLGVSCAGGTANATGVSWPDMLRIRGYVPSRKKFDCPALSLAATVSAANGGSAENTLGIGINYLEWGINVSDNNPPTSFTNQRKETDVTASPSTFFVFADSGAVMTDPATGKTSHDSDSWIGIDRTGTAFFRSLELVSITGFEIGNAVCPPRHARRTNAGFLDSHVESRKNSSLGFSFPYPASADSTALWSRTHR